MDLRTRLFLLVVIFYCNAQAQKRYVIPPRCSDTAGNPLVVYFTSDDGWHEFDRKLADSLCAENMPLLGFNSYIFFRKRKTPQQTLDNVLPYIDRNLKKFNTQKIILAGYSFGSEVVPFLYNLMSPVWKSRVAMIIMISPTDNSDFKIHFFDMIGLNPRRWPYDVLNEIMKIDDTKIIVFWGKGEKKFLKKEFTKHNITVHHIKGGHRRTEVTPVIDYCKALKSD